MGDHGSRLTDFGRFVFSDDNFAIFQSIAMKLEIWVDINPNLNPLKYQNALVTTITPD